MVDVLEKYKLMCIESDELQKLWTPQLGDFYWDGKYNELDLMSYSCIKPHEEDYGYWWIPRLDQLIDLSGLDWWTFLKGLTSSVDHDEGEDVLCVAMRYVKQLRYNQFWNGSRWIDE